MRIRYTLLGLGLGLLLGSHALAQEIDCPILENAAFNEARLWCTDMTSGQWCYGNSRIEAEASGGQRFAVPGDKISIAAAARVTSYTGANLWGVALAQIEVYPVTNWLPAPAALVLLGDAALTNTHSETAQTAVQTWIVAGAERANLRSRPTPTARIVGGVTKGDLVKVFGRLSNNAWLQVLVPNGGTGWVASEIVPGDWDTLPVVTPDDRIMLQLSRPFAAFDLVTSANPARCPQAPASGLLIQTLPDNAYRFEVNEALIELSGTAFLQASAATGMTLATVEGTALIRIAGTAWEVPAGSQLILPLRREITGRLIAADPPEQPTARYAIEPLLPLPLRLLPRTTYLSFDIRSLLTPQPADGSSPLAGLLVTDPCTLTVGTDGVNLRAGPGFAFPVRALMNFRESARPVGRAFGSDGGNWWMLAPNVWISGGTTVTGGDCAAVPLVEVPPPPQPTPTPAIP